MINNINKLIACFTDTIKRRKYETFKGKISFDYLRIEHFKSVDIAK